jgi:hypothetical protein
VNTRIAAFTRFTQRRAQSVSDGRRPADGTRTSSPFLILNLIFNFDNVVIGLDASQSVAFGDVSQAACPAKRRLHIQERLNDSVFFAFFQSDPGRVVRLERARRVR